MSHNLKDDDFTLVSHKRKQKKPEIAHISEEIQAERTPFEKETAIRRTLEAKEDIQTSDFYTSIKASLNEGLQLLGKPRIKEVVCFGLGKFVECMISRYQLALLLCLKDLFEANVHAGDPAFTCIEHEVLAHFGIRLIAENLEGKYSCEESCTAFFLPHCPKQLSNNLLWANWGLGLSRCVIIANSFHKILEDNTRRALASNAGYLVNISPYVVELAIINSFRYFDIFNDTAVHVFPTDRLSLIPRDLWDDRTEPSYLEDDVEFVTKIAGLK